jgi:hypothetical protein
MAPRRSAFRGDYRGASARIYVYGRSSKRMDPWTIDDNVRKNTQREERKDLGMQPKPLPNADDDEWWVGAEA